MPSDKDPRLLQTFGRYGIRTLDHASRLELMDYLIKDFGPGPESPSRDRTPKRSNTRKAASEKKPKKRAPRDILYGAVNLAGQVVQGVIGVASSLNKMAKSCTCKKKRKKDTLVPRPSSDPASSGCSTIYTGATRSASPTDGTGTGASSLPEVCMC